VVHRLKRNWIGIELAEGFDEFYFYGKGKNLGLLGRMKIGFVARQKIYGYR